MDDADGDGAADDDADDGWDEADDDEPDVLEPPQAVSPRMAAAVRPTKARVGRLVDNIVILLVCGPGAPDPIGSARVPAVRVPRRLCLTSYSEVAVVWMGADRRKFRIPAAEG